MDLTRRIAACGILLEFIRFPIAPFSGSRVEVIGTLSREDLGEIRRVVGRAEIAMEQPQFPPELPRLSWKRVRVLPTYVRIRMANRIVSMVISWRGCRSRWLDAPKALYPKSQVVGRSG